MLFTTTFNPFAQILRDIAEKNIIYIGGSRYAGMITKSAILLSLYWIYRQATVIKDDTPLVPYIWPLYGSTREYYEDPEAFLRRCTEKYGHVFRVHLNGRIQTIVSGTPVREIFLNNDFDFHFAVRKRFDINLLVDISIKTLPDAALRNLVMNLTGHLKYYTPRVVQYLDISSKEFFSGFSTNPIYLPHLYPLVSHMVSKASASVFVGSNIANNPAVVESFKSITKEVGSEIVLDSLLFEAFPFLNRIHMMILGKTSKAMKKHKKIIFTAIRPEIDRRVKEAKTCSKKEPDDILQVVLNSYYADRNDVDAIASDVTKWLIILVFGAIHNTAENTTVVFYRMIDHPGVLDTLLEEQNQVLERHGIRPDETDPTKMFTANVIKDMCKLDSACREGLRLRNDFLSFTHTYLGRRALKLSTGTIIHPGDDVKTNTWYNHRTPSVQKTDDSDYLSYKPFRFVGKNRGSDKIGDDFLLFGEGKHACPGRRYALMVMKVIISMLIRNYKIRATGSIVYPTHVQSKMPVGEILLERRM